MSSQQSESFTAEEGLKFISFVLRTFQEEYDYNLSVDSDLLAAVIDQEHPDNMNLIIEQDDGRTILRAELDED